MTDIPAKTSKATDSKISTPEEYHQIVLVDSIAF
jgi:hypothetical protein